MRFSLGNFYGNTLKNFSTGGVKLSETVYDSTLRLSLHSHEAPYLCFVLQGNFTEFYEQKRRLCHPATLIFHPAGEKHADEFHTPARCFNIQPDVSWLGRIPQNAPVLNSPADFRDGFLTQLARRLYREFCRPDQLSALVIECLTLEILVESDRRSVKSSSKRSPRWLTTAREILHDRFNENFSISQLARTVGVHEAHLSREFRKFYRSTVGEYVRQLRIEFACRELSSSVSSLVDIALAAGFTDQSHFGKTFKQIIGISPAAYRKRVSSLR